MPNYYTSFDAVRKQITHSYAPYEPELVQDSDRNSLKSAALRFVHRRCVGLRFDPAKEDEYTTGHYTGKSLRKNQIPYNMERDVDRLCLERALGDFLDTGTREDAYTVYYCFLNMFLDGYSNSKVLFESLSEYEQNASTLLKKHRDHYSHSVYVFALGLAIYETNTAFRRAFASRYEQGGADAAEKERKTAHFFLEYWGLCALFHDIGYPFELSYELAMVYYDREGKRRGSELYPAYRGAESLARLHQDEAKHIAGLFGREFARLEEVLAADIVDKLKVQYTLDETEISEKLMQRPEQPEQCDFYMDHAYFSALRLYRQLVDRLGLEKMRKEHFDVLSAIVLHNSLFKVSIRGKEPPYQAAMRMDSHPLAYLLMLCDELQCWDRIAYGRKSRRTQYPIDAKFRFLDSEVKVSYLFVPELKETIHTYRDNFTRTGTIQGNLGLELYISMQDADGKFLKELGSIVDLTSAKLSITTGYSKLQNGRTLRYLSRKSFLNLYDLAVTLHTLNHKDWLPDHREKNYLAQSLEYQLSGINRAKAFAGFLEKMTNKCFYSERLLNCNEVKRFTPEEMNEIAPLEHGRWMREHIKMGWHVSETEFKDKDARELRRCHHLLLKGTPNDEEIADHYFHKLSPKEQKKDILPFTRLIRILKAEGVRIYRMEQKPLKSADGWDVPLFKQTARSWSRHW